MGNLEHDDHQEENFVEDDSQNLEKTIIDSLKTKMTASFTPENAFVLPIATRPFFPGMAAPLIIEPGPFYEVLKIVANTNHRSVVLMLTKKENVDINEVTFKDMFKVGVLARILRIIPLEEGGAQVVLNMEKRAKLKAPIAKSKYLRGKFEYYENSKKISKELKAYSLNIVTTIKELLKLNPLFKEELQIFLDHSDFISDPGKLADFAVALTTAGREELQDVLSSFDISIRIDKALILLKKELDLGKLQNSIHQKMETNISKHQREFFLKEQLKTIKKELGLEKDDKACDIEKFTDRLKKRHPSKEILQVIEEEIDKLKSLETISPEYSVSRSYLDWLTVIPWGVFSKDNTKIGKARDILEKDHYGLADIKKRMLEFISVGILSQETKGNIICLVGPPGVGKTSVGRSIARALNRKFYRFSVGGMRDEAEIKGHRRTYIGAMPGKIIQALKNAKTMNPVIMLDEVDKIGASYHGDPASALLEVLDPEQNKDFLDHYMDVRCDLSRILFILTANVLDTIPPPLRDRAEIMRLSGYITEEKLQIAKKYLIPRHRKECGLNSSQIEFSEEALRYIINKYAREAGVRDLEKQIKKILRKVTLEIVEEKEKKKKKTAKRKIIIKKTEYYLGKPVFTSEEIYEKTPVGVCTGLAWTALGGETIYIEAIKVANEKTYMMLTGQAGDVMKESSQIAWSYLHSNTKQYAPKIEFFAKSHVHIHIPEGATPKDGPSAGITMVTAVLSLLRDQPILENLGMTGELTLTGRVLPIGGLKEKLIAARRAGLKTLIFPKENKSDYDELPDFLKEGLSINFVEQYEDVFKLAFGKKRPTKATKKRKHDK